MAVASYLLLSVSYLSLKAASASAVCYFKSSSSSTVQVGYNSYPCNNTGTNYQSCCNNGDICGEDSLCYHPKDSAGSVGYLIGGCTDPTFGAAECSSHCSTYAFQNVAYDPSKGLWGCCGDGIAHCSTPATSEYFSAIAEASWSALPSLATSTASPTSTATASSTSAGTSSPSASTVPSRSPTPDPKPTGLSTGAEAGIGIGVAVAVIAILALLGLLWRRRRTRSRGHQRAELESTPAQIQNGGVQEMYHDKKQPHQHQQGYAEMPSEPPVYEAP